MGQVSSRCVGQGGPPCSPAHGSPCYLALRFWFLMFLLSCATVSYAFCGFLLADATVCSVSFLLSCRLSFVYLFCFSLLAFAPCSLAFALSDACFVFTPAIRYFHVLFASFWFCVHVAFVTFWRSTSHCLVFILFLPRVSFLACCCLLVLVTLLESPSEVGL